MAVFLNTQKLAFWLKELIDRSKEEVILVVPYIQTSKAMYNSLRKADERGVDITLIYRENQLSPTEKNKILSLQNLNLLHHPNIHCKCYFNGELLILGSMNLYEYSEINNREMGVLLHTIDVDEEKNKRSLRSATDSDEVFYDAIDELREIINGSAVEKINRKKHPERFELELIKTNEDFAIEKCRKYNRHFISKKFKPVQVGERTWYCQCDSFYDKVDVIVEGRRIAIKFRLLEKEMKVLFQKWKAVYNEFEFTGFKYYLYYTEDAVMLYQDLNFDWEGITDDTIRLKKIGQGINSIIQKYTELSGK